MVTNFRMVICLAIVFGVLVLSKPIYRLIGKAGIEAASRVCGLILASIGVNGIIVAIRISFREGAPIMVIAGTAPLQWRSSC